MRHCPTCGIELPATARFCSHCGETLIVPAAIDKSTQMNSSQPADAQLRDVSAVPTHQLTNHTEKEEDPSQDSTTSASTQSESQPAQTLYTPAPLAQTEPPVSPPQRRRSSSAQWLIIGLIILVLIAGSAGALVWLHPFSPAPTTTGTPDSRGTLSGGQVMIHHTPTPGVTPTISTCPGSSSATCLATTTRTASTPV